MSQQTLRLEMEGAIGTIILSRPEQRNTICEALVIELEQALDTVAATPALRTLIITGSGSCFMAGGDISMMKTGLEHPYDFFRLHDRITRIGNRLTRLRIPVIAAINGHALGGGLELALACDIRILSTTARLGLPEVGLGIMASAGGTARLAHLIGRERALYLGLTGEAVDADEALRLGLVARVVAPELVLPTARQLAQRIAAQAPESVAMIKRAVTLAADMPLEGAVDFCQAAGMLLGGTEDCREGFSAFLEKRPPRWQGR